MSWDDAGLMGQLQIHQKHKRNMLMHRKKKHLYYLRFTLRNVWTPYTVLRYRWYGDEFFLCFVIITNYMVLNGCR